MRIWVFACVLMFAGGCSGGHGGSAPDGDPFTLVVYLAGDNDLSGEASQKLEALRHGFDPKAGAQVFVYIDEAGTGPRLVELGAARDGSVVAETLIEYPEHNSASAQVFGDVLEEVAARSVGGKYGLVFFSHASGWLPRGALANPARGGVSRSLGRDGADEMELADFAAAIPDGMFDYIVMEACYMAGVEVAYALRGKTVYILASAAEIVSPGFTNIYPGSLGLLLAGSEGLVPFARATFDHYDARAGWERSATFSVIDTREVEELVEFMRTVPEIGLAGSVANVQAFDRYARHLFFDLSDSLEQYLPEEDITRLQALIDKCLVWKAATPSFLPGYGGFEIVKHSGLTTYRPQTQFPVLNEIWLDMLF